MLEVIKYSSNVRNYIRLVTRLKEIHLIYIYLVINPIYNSDNLQVIFAKKRDRRG